MDRKQFDIFNKELLKLKEKLKCPICFDLIEEHAELECGHRFCSNCFTKHRSITIKETSCPLCKAVIKRRSIIYKDIFADEISSFLSDVCKEIENMTASTNSEEICEKQLDSKKAISNQPSTSKKYVSKYVKSSQIKVTELDKDELTKTKGKSSEIKKAETNNQLETSKGEYEVTNMNISQQSISKDEAFDKLLGLCVNKKGKQYKNTKKANNERELEYKILDFQDDANKDAVLHWLNDTRNQFGRLTQTQHMHGEQRSENSPTMELPSVSQVGKNRGRKSHFPRAKSLDIQVKRKRETRRSDRSVTGAENYTIEETNTEEDAVNKAKENVLLQIMEDEYLNKMEHALHTKTDNSNKIPLTNQDSSAGWQRIEKLSKSLKSNKKEPKKLKVIVQHIQNTNSKKTVANTSTGNLSNEDVGKNKEQIPPISELNVMHKKVQEPKEYNLEEFEHYVEENMKPISNEIDASTVSQGSNKENNERLSNVNKKPEIIVILENLIINDADDDPYILPTQKMNRLENKEQIPAAKTAEDEPVLINELQGFGEVMAVLLNNLKKYAENLDKNKQLTKQHIKNIQNHLNKLNDLYNASHSKVSMKKHVDQNIQTEQTVANVEIQTEAFNMVDSEVQTEAFSMVDSEVQTEDKSYCDMEIQTLRVGYCNNCDIKNSADKLSGTNSKKRDSPEVIQNDVFGASLDLINFETEEFEKECQPKRVVVTPKEKHLEIEQHEIIVLSPNILEAPNFENDADDLNEDAQEETKNILECTLKSDITKKHSQNLKRPLSDSDSSDIIVVPKKRCNRFIRDDLSVEFGLSANTQKEIKSTTVSIDSDEDNNNEDYLNKIMKKYESGTNNVTSPVTKSPKENSNMELDLDIVNCVNENVNRLSKLNSSCKSQRSNKTTQDLDDDSLFLNEQNLSKLDNEIEPCKDLRETESSDIIAETESMEPIPKKAKMKILDREVAPTENSDSSVKPMKSTYCRELEDSFNEMDFANIQMENENLKKKESEDDLFSEDDYVESTPPQQQRESFEKRSQNAVANLMTRFANLDEVDKEIIENFDTNFAPLSPPPGFEDDNNSTAPEEVTVIKLNNVKTDNLIDGQEEPNELPAIDKLPEDSINNKMVTSTPGKNLSLNADRRKLLHSTPLSQNIFPTDTLGFSPIVQEKSAYEKALKSNTIISNISQESPRSRNLLTSFPKQKSILNYVKPSQVCNQRQLEQKPCIACTRLNKDQIQSISILTNRKLASYSPKFTSAVTHMIVTVDDSRRIKDYTMKFVSAVACGIWVVGFEWIQECLRTNSIVPEEPYEVLDDSGQIGPKMARLTRLEQPLLKNYKFYCVSPLYSTTLEDVEELISRLGGIMVNDRENLKEKDGKISLIITEGRSTQDFEIYEKWLEKYKVVTVDIEWLSRSVGRYKILSVRPYLWCSDDNIDDLGYPNYLTENTSSSSEQF